MKAFLLLTSLTLAGLVIVRIRRELKKPLALTPSEEKQLSWGGKLNWPIDEWPPQTRYSGEDEAS